MSESNEEQWASAAVCAATGAVATPYDHSGRNRAVDYLLDLPNGSKGALEVTSHAEPGSQEVAGLLRREEFQWPNPGRWKWTIAIDPNASLKKVRRIYAYVIKACETHGVRSPEDLPFELLMQDTVLWNAAYDQFDVRFHGAIDSTCVSGTVTVLPGSIGGGVDEALVGLPAAITDLLHVHHIAEHVDKLLDHPAVTERHLFITLGAGAIPFPQYYPLCSRVVALPSVAPSVASGITYLWFSTTYGPSLIGWSAASGWTSSDVFTSRASSLDPP